MDDYLNIALPKGRLGEDVYSLFASCGYECDGVMDDSRRLVFENPECRVRYFWVKPWDVGVYVERGAADIGVAGKDTIIETAPDVFEIGDLRLGKCRMACAAPDGFTDDGGTVLRVATKYPNIARSYYSSMGREIDIVKLSGSIEIAPLLGLTDVIVDIVETGRTLRENGLSVTDVISDISARLIVNRASYRFRGEQIRELAGKLSSRISEEAERR